MHARLATRARLFAHSSKHSQKTSSSRLVAADVKTSRVATRRRNCSSQLPLIVACNRRLIQRLSTKNLRSSLGSSETEDNDASFCSVDFALSMHSPACTHPLARSKRRMKINRTSRSKEHGGQSRGRQRRSSHDDHKRRRQANRVIHVLAATRRGARSLPADGSARLLSAPTCTSPALSPLDAPRIANARCVNVSAHLAVDLALVVACATMALMQT